MENKSQATLYIGLLLVIIGILVFLDINGLLPGTMLSICSNGLIAVVLLIGYCKKRHLWQVVLGTFFAFNAILMLMEGFIHINIIVRILALIATMFLAAYCKIRRIGYLIPGALLLSWSLYFFGISTNLINGFFVGAGMWVLAQSLGFGIVYLCERVKWARAIVIITGIIGLMIVVIGLDGIEQYVLLNGLTVCSIIIGLVLIMRYLFQNRDNRGK